MARDGTIVIGNRPFTLIQDSQLPSGKRAFSKELRPSQHSDPSRLGEAQWQFGGTPIGVSREGTDGRLALDYADNIEVRFDDLLTAAPAATAITLTATDPTGTSTAMFYGTAIYGGGVYQGGTAGVTPGNVTHIDEQQNMLFFHRDSYSTQVNTSWTVLQSVVHGGRVLGAENWQGYGWVGLGAISPLQKRTGVTSAGATYSDVSVSGTNIYAGELRKGNDRLWLVRADTNQARYTLDDFTSISNAFDVGDSGRNLTGIGTLGPLTVFGAEDGVFSFTDSGKPIRVNEALRGHRSTNNGARHASQWGWDYYITDFGIYAWSPNVNNPVGLEAFDGFDGAIDGRPTAVFAWREYLFATYLTTGGDSYVILGKFGPGTAVSGQPDWYPFIKLTGVESECIWATSLQTNPTLLIGSGTNAVRITMGRRGRDIADLSYVFSTGGGTWFGTTMTRAQNLHKYIRLFYLFSEQCTSAKTWQLAVSADGGSYVNIGAPVSANGHHVLRPTTGGAPLPTVDFHTLKPRLVQVNNSTTTPPQLRGHLTLIYDERPDMVTEVRAAVLTRAGDEDALETYVGHDTETPQRISLPGDSKSYYGFVTGAGPLTDIRGDGISAMQVTMILWDTD